MLQSQVETAVVGGGAFHGVHVAARLHLAIGDSEGAVLQRHFAGEVGECHGSAAAVEGHVAQRAAGPGEVGGAAGGVAQAWRRSVPARVKLYSASTVPVAQLSCISAAS